MQLSTAKKLAYDLLKQENLLQQGWTCSFDDSITHLGVCDYRKRQIGLSRYFIALNSDEITLDTIKHEVAHALTPGAGHGAVWQREAVRLGGNPQATCGDAIAPEGYFQAVCLKCNASVKKHRLPQRFTSMVCGGCCKKFEQGNYSDKFLLQWTNLKTNEVYRDGNWICQSDEKFSRSLSEEIIAKYNSSVILELNQIGFFPDFQYGDYDFKNTPAGVFRAFLDLKMWRDIKGYRIIKTYWRNIAGDGFVIDIWENTFSSTFETADKRCDIEKMKIGKWYELIVMKTEKGFLRLQTAKISN